MKENDLIKKINKIIPEAKAVPMKEFYDVEISGGIWFKGSEDYCKTDDLPIFDYYEEFGNDIHPTLEKILDDAGWYGEPYDVGTLMAYEK
jgi:hypothetical protein